MDIEQALLPCHTQSVTQSGVDECHNAEQPFNASTQGRKSYYWHHKSWKAHSKSQASKYLCWQRKHSVAVLSMPRIGLVRSCYVWVAYEKRLVEKKLKFNFFVKSSPSYLPLTDNVLRSDKYVFSQPLAVVKWGVVRHFIPPATKILKVHCCFSPISYFSNMTIFEDQSIQKSLSDFFHSKFIMKKNI